MRELRGCVVSKRSAISGNDTQCFSILKDCGAAAEELISLKRKLVYVDTNNRGLPSDFDHRSQKEESRLAIRPQLSKRDGLSSS